MTTITLTTHSSHSPAPIVLWQAGFEVRPVPENARLLHVLDERDDETPLVLLDEDNHPVRDLSEEETTAIMSAGVVTQVICRHPRADKYGSPLVGGPFEELSAAVVGSMGWTVAQGLKSIAYDTKDDSCESYVLTVAVPPDVIVS